jgi:DNA-directed RNA polymerase specialized sigma24 family protein
MGKDAKGKDVTVSAVDMVPDRTDKQTEVRKAPQGAPWPDHIEALERLLARLPERLLKVACVYYISGASIRQAAATLRVSKDELGRRLERVRWFVAGQISALDDGLSRQ